MIGKDGVRFPYTSIKQLGIVFEGLPQEVKKDIGEIPKSPDCYGSAQLRKLWQAKDKWNFTISLPPSSHQATPSSSLISTSTTALSSGEQATNSVCTPIVSSSSAANPVYTVTSAAFRSSDKPVCTVASAAFSSSGKPVYTVASAAFSSLAKPVDRASSSAPNSVANSVHTVASAAGSGMAISVTRGEFSSEMMSLKSCFYFSIAYRDLVCLIKMIEEKVLPCYNISKWLELRVLIDKDVKL